MEHKELSDALDNDDVDYFKRSEEPVYGKIVREAIFAKAYKVLKYLLKYQIVDGEDFIFDALWDLRALKILVKNGYTIRKKHLEIVLTNNHIEKKDLPMVKFMLSKCKCNREAFDYITDRGVFYGTLGQMLLENMLEED